MFKVETTILVLQTTVEPSAYATKARYTLEGAEKPAIRGVSNNLLT